MAKCAPDAEPDIAELVGRLNHARATVFAEIFPHDDYAFVVGPWAAQGLMFATDLLRLMTAELVAGAAPYGSHLSLLDVGAGPGFGTELLGRLFATNVSGYKIDCTALELSPQWGRFYPYLHNHAGVIIGDLFDQPDNSYDIVVSSHVIEHLPRAEVVPFVKKMQSLARLATIVICPWQEGCNRHPAHAYSVDHDLLNELHPDHWEAFHSLGWHNPTGRSRCLGMVFRQYALPPSPSAQVAWYRGWLAAWRRRTQK